MRILAFSFLCRILYLYNLGLYFIAMNVSILQMVSVVSYSNAYLNDRLPEISNQGEKISMYCNKVLFHIPVVGDKNQYTTQAPIDWFISLKFRGVKQVKLFYQSFAKPNTPEYMTAGFVGGGGVWMVETVLEDRSEFWYSKWEVNEDKRQLGADRVWDVIYRLAPIHELASTKYDVTVQSIALASVLEELVTFCKQEELSNWEAIFSGAKSVLENKKPSSAAYLKDMIVEGGYTDEALALMEAADRAYVFGGMGSWNDVGQLSDDAQEQKYKELSAQLYAVLNQSILAFTNS